MLVYLAPVSNPRAGLLVPFALACAGSPSPLPAGVSPRPALGDSLAALLAKLPHADEPGPRIELEELRVLAVEREPWTRLDPADPRAADGRVAVVAGRRCAERSGLSTARAERASWFLLASDAIVAFDHDGFARECVPLPAFEPSPASDVGVERMLVRYVTQRWPGDAVPPADRLPRGLALLARERPDDALAELQALDRQIAELERRTRGEGEDDDPEEQAARAALHAEAEELRPLRAELYHALAAAREQGEGR